MCGVRRFMMRIPATCTLRHVKGHQDDLYKGGKEGPLSRDAFWNVQMNKKANMAQLPTPTQSATVFESSLAEFIHKDQPVHTKIGHSITKAFLDQPLQRYIQQKENWTDQTFDSVGLEGI